ncbi:MAG: N(1)-aminopropylagmatine ureohydrolase [Promethearchaeota archaeon]|nr:MAG: N(1)-aminopropylagmatine ureohydrolase [Candidatus Lokiarchaeota archaeon]
MKFFDFGEVVKNDTEFVLFGFPWDYLTSIDLPNSSNAPEQIREVTNDLALTTEMGTYIPELKVVDLGDIEIITNNVEQNLRKAREFVKNIYKQKDDVIPIMIGGDHFCSFPIAKAVGDHFKEKKKLGMLIFDAHLDLYEEWDKGVYSHATISHRLYDLAYINNKNLLIVGTRDIDIPEYEIAEKEQISYLNAHELTAIDIDAYRQRILNFFRDSNISHLYVSIDIDALDPSIAPGTGFAIPGGFTYRQLWHILHEISTHFNVIGFDLVEVAPNLDLPNRITRNLAAKLIIEFISFISNQKT